MSSQVRWVLRDDVQITPANDLPDALRKTTGELKDGALILRSHSRFDPTWVDSLAARLAEQFRRPVTIEHALAELCRGEDRSPTELIAEAGPLLEQLVAKEVLVSEGTLEARANAAGLEPGDRFRDTTVVRTVAVADDRELYLVRLANGRFAALKLQHTSSSAMVGDLAHEARILRHLDGGVAPTLLDSGTMAGEPWVLLDWRPGIDPVTAAAEWRDPSSRMDRRKLLELMKSIVRAYVSLHEQRVLHGDVHPGNLLVTDTDSVTVLDFGLARLDGEPTTPPRGGHAFFLDPQLAHASSGGSADPPLTEACEQYSLCATLYRIAAGVPYLRFDLRRRRLLRQIVEEDPLPFSAHGLEPWPELEKILRRGLAKQPVARFSSTTALAAALEGLRIGARAHREVAPAPSLQALVQRVLDQVALDGPLFRTGLAAPAASVALGAAGIARVLLRASMVRDDPAMLSCADLWASRAAAEAGEEAFYSDEGGFARDVIGTISPIYAAPGPPLVAAEVAAARGDRLTWAESVTRFLALTRGDLESDDLFFGGSGVLLGIARLAELDAALNPVANVAIVPDEAEAARGSAKTRPGPGRGILSSGTALMADLITRWETRPPLGQTDDVLGMAHGWAGRLYATLRYCTAAQVDVPESIRDRLHQLSSLAQPVGRGFGWSQGGSDHTLGDASWCGGSAGLVHLWSLAARALPGEGFGQLAEAAGWTTFDAPAPLADICCGLAGRAYALLDLYRLSDDRGWFARATDLAVRAEKRRADLPGPPWSLLKGELGICALVLDLERPREATLPLFE